MLLTVPVESHKLRALVGFKDAWTHFNALTHSQLIKAMASEGRNDH